MNTDPNTTASGPADAHPSLCRGAPAPTPGVPQ